MATKELRILIKLCELQKIDVKINLQLLKRGKYKATLTHANLLNVELRTVRQILRGRFSFVYFQNDCNTFKNISLNTQFYFCLQLLFEKMFHKTTILLVMLKAR